MLKQLNPTARAAQAAQAAQAASLPPDNYSKP